MWEDRLFRTVGNSGVGSEWRRGAEEEDGGLQLFGVYSRFDSAGSKRRVEIFF